MAAQNVQRSDEAATRSVIAALKSVYKNKIQPLELHSRYDLFHGVFMSDADFDAKPHVMLIGQYSVGKTSFVRYLLGQDFPGQRIGPEPTTDRFTVVFDGPVDRLIPGNALAVSNDLPYRGLETFGMAFLNKFEGSQVPSKVLQYITLVDTPGVLSGQKQTLNRGYNFNGVTSWFAFRSDLIILLFDAHKLDISDEFRAVMASLNGNQDKIRCILNKADEMDKSELIRSYGALLWSLGRILNTPEVMKVYIGSFWSEPLKHEENIELFHTEEEILMKDIGDLPKNSAVRKINNIVKRVRVGRVHAYIIGYLKDQMPKIMGHAKKQTQLIENLESIFRTISATYNICINDFPNIADYKSKLSELDFCKFKKVNMKLIQDVDSALDSDLPKLMMALPSSKPVELNYHKNEETKDDTMH